MTEFIWRLVAWIVARPRIVARLEGRAVWPSIRLHRVSPTDNGLLFAGSRDMRVIVLRGVIVEHQSDENLLDLRRPGYTKHIPAGERFRASAFAIERVLLLLISWGPRV